MLGSPPPTLLGAEYYSCNNNTGGTNSASSNNNTTTILSMERQASNASGYSISGGASGASPDTRMKSHKLKTSPLTKVHGTSPSSRSRTQSEWQSAWTRRTSRADSEDNSSTDSDPYSPKYDNESLNYDTRSASLHADAAPTPIKTARRSSRHTHESEDDDDEEVQPPEGIVTSPDWYRDDNDSEDRDEEQPSFRGGMNNSVNTGGGASGTSDSSIENHYTADHLTPIDAYERDVALEQGVAREGASRGADAVCERFSIKVSSWRLWNAEDEDVQPESPAEQRSRRGRND